MKQQTFLAGLKDLHSMLSFISSYAKDENMDQKSIRELELAAEEAIVNIIYHAYKQKGGNVQIELDKKENQIEVTIIDQGPEFNPILQKEEQSKRNENKMGGLGIILMCSYVDDIKYQRENYSNILILKKSIYLSQKK